MPALFTRKVIGPKFFFRGLHQCGDFFGIWSRPRGSPGHEPAIRGSHRQCVPGRVRPSAETDRGTQRGKLFSDGFADATAAARDQRDVIQTDRVSPAPGYLPCLCSSFDFFLAQATNFMRNSSYSQGCRPGFGCLVRCAGSRQVFDGARDTVLSEHLRISVRPTCEWDSGCTYNSEVSERAFFFAGMSSGTGECLWWLPDCVILKMR